MTWTTTGTRIRRRRVARATKYARTRSAASRVEDEERSLGRSIRRRAG